MSDQSPLRTAGDRWQYSQPNLGFEAKYVSIDQEGKREVRTMKHLATCREGMISRTRSDFQEVFCKKKTNEKIACKDKNDEDSADYIDGSFSSNIHKKRLLS